MKGADMKKLTLFLLITFVSLFGAAPVFSQEDVTKHPSCKYCGMDRVKFAHSRVYVEFEDGTTEGTCSIHCAAIDFSLNIDKAPKAMLVGDYNTKKLVDVENAVWVIGGNKPGVMTKRAKWAFANSEDAQKFITENGGTLSTFEQAFKGSYEDMYADTKMIRDRRMARKQKMMEHKH
jgi:nitrous oxide reductase accessory protein NosL